MFHAFGEETRRKKDRNADCPAEREAIEQNADGLDGHSRTSARKLNPLWNR